MNRRSTGRQSAVGRARRSPSLPLRLDTRLERVLAPEEASPVALMTLRYDMRIPEIASGSGADRYAACLAQCAWADGLGFQTCAISEHHGVEDGFLPAPLVLAGAITARTQSMMVMISALLLPFHDPLRLAEDLAVLSLLSNGRVGIVAGIGSRQEEFDAFGSETTERVG